MSNTHIKTILLRGYYGFGNLGDDLLMISCYELIKKRFPDAQIFVFSFSKHAEYISKILPEVAVISAHTSSYDLIVHGGGGVYFDFKNGSWKNTAVNRLSRLIGIKNHARLLKFYRKLRGIKTETSKWRVGLGIGVGTYTPSSKKLSSSLVAISDYDWLMVRDKKSAKNFKKINKFSQLIVGSDLVFADLFWTRAETTKVGLKKTIGLVIRDVDHINLNESLIKQLTDSSYDFSIFILDKLADKQLVESLKNLKNVHVWEAESQSVGNYISLMNETDLLITSRAHGAIIGSLIAIPSIIIGIEPKLETIHRMFPQSSEYLEVEKIDTELNKKIDLCFAELDSRKQYLIDELTLNKKALQNSLDEFDSFLQSL